MPLILFVNNLLKKYLHKEKGMRSKSVKAETIDNTKHLSLLVGYFFVGFRYAQPNLRLNYLLVVTFWK
ncbi:hypothetical protein CWC17_02940 [Pseudoalteromonas sp. S3785]|nr:hypothetical protein CWC17_02940 [Pseudoalteromonas sp. S3785]